MTSKDKFLLTCDITMVLGLTARLVQTMVQDDDLLFLVFMIASLAFWIWMTIEMFEKVTRKPKIVITPTGDPRARG
jgi:hypothetical protein